MTYSGYQSTHCKRSLQTEISMTSFRPYIVGIGGTTRPGSSSEKALRYALALAEAQGADVELFDGASINLPMYAPESPARSEDAQRLISALRRAHGVILSTPCYHGSVSGPGEERAGLYGGHVQGCRAIPGWPSGGTHRLRAWLAIHRRGAVGVPIHRARVARVAHAYGRFDQHVGGTVRRKWRRACRSNRRARWRSWWDK